MDCIGEERAPDGSLWLCDICQLRSEGLKVSGCPTFPHCPTFLNLSGLIPPSPFTQFTPACVLCPVVGGPMKRTNDGRWCHLMCAMWTPHVGFANPAKREPIEGLDQVGKAECDQV